MLSLDSIMSMGYPNIWVTTSDQYSWMTNQFQEISDRHEVYFLDASLGLAKWSNTKQTWLPVVMTFNDPDIGDVGGVMKIQNAAMAYRYLAINGGYMVMLDADKAVDNLQSTIGINHIAWLNSIRRNDLDSLKIPRMILLSPESLPDPVKNSCIAAPDNDAFTMTPQRAAVIMDRLSHVVGNHLDPSVTAEDVSRHLRGVSEAHAFLILGSGAWSDTTLTTNDIAATQHADIKASTSLSIVTPKTSLEDIGGLDIIKDLIISNKYLMDHPDEAAAADLTPARRVLMMGLPGTGKSMICEAAAKSLGWDLASVGVGKAMNKFIGESENNIRVMFEELAALAPIVAWVDEIGRDLAGGASSNFTDGGTTSRVHGELLTALQNLPDNVFFMAASNALEHIAFEMLRAERWDAMFFVGFPAHVERVQIFHHYLSSIVDGDFNYDQLAEATPCWTGAEMLSYIKATKRQVWFSQRRPLTHADLMSQVKTFRNRIWLKKKEEVMASYRQAIEQYDWASSFQQRDAEMIAGGKDATSPGTKKTFAIK